MALDRAVRVGGLERYQVEFESGEMPERMLWVKPDMIKLLNSHRLDARQSAQAKVALRRFVVGGEFTVITAAGAHREVEKVGDLKELKGDTPPFIEMRFKPPKVDLRFFGRFVGKDACLMIFTS